MLFPLKRRFKKLDIHKTLLVPKILGFKHLKTQINPFSAWFYLPKCVPALKSIHDKEAIFVDTKILISASPCFNKTQNH
jgi:hypothetical protein